MATLSPELEAYLPRLIQIESGGDPNARTGSYSGLLQMGPDEIAKYGGNGLEQGKQLLADRAGELAKVLGRDPTPTELYLAHQQGMGGATAHLTNPDAPAWQNMASTGEGRKRGDAWAKQAIWGNVPDDLKAQYPGGVDSLTSRQFVDLWRSKVERTPRAPTASPAPANASAQTALNLPPQAAPIFPPDASAQQQPAQQIAPQQQAAPAAPPPLMAQMPAALELPPPIFAPLKSPIDMNRLRSALQASGNRGFFNAQKG